MEYNKIIAVTGLPGLYELLSSKTDGAIVRSLDDKTTRFVASRVHNFSHLESIEVFTVRDNVNLVDILKAMEASPEKLPDEKDAAALKAYFGKVYPDLDFGRVYSSDLKKMVKWYAVLKANDIEIKLTEVEEEEAPEESAEETETAVPKRKAEKAGKEEKPAKEEKVEKTAKKTEEKPEKTAKPEKAVKAAKPEKTEKAEKTEKTDKAAKPAKKATEAAKPKKAAKKK